MGKKSRKSEEVEQVWEVEKIVDRRYIRGKPEYLLKWKNWNGAPTWQALNKGDCPELLKAFEKECREKESRESPIINARTPKNQSSKNSRVIIDESEDSDQEPSTSVSTTKSKRSTTPSTAKKPPAKKTTKSKRKTNSPNSSSTRSRSTSRIQQDEPDGNNFPSLSASEDEAIETAKKSAQKEKTKPTRASKRLSSNKNGVAAKHARRDSIETVTLDDDEDDEPSPPNDPKPSGSQLRESSPVLSIKSTKDQTREPSPARSVALSVNSEDGNLVIDDEPLQVEDSMDMDENEQTSTASNYTSFATENFFENIDISFLQQSPVKASSQKSEPAIQMSKSAEKESQIADNATEPTSVEPGSTSSPKEDSFQQIISALLAFKQREQNNDVTESTETATEQDVDVTESIETVTEQNDDLVENGVSSINKSSINEPTSENNLNETVTDQQQLETSIETVNDQPFSSFQSTRSFDQSEQGNLVIDEEETQNVSTKTAVELEIQTEPVEVEKDQVNTNMEETEQSSAVSLLEESLPPNGINMCEANNETSSKDVTLLDESNVLNKSFDTEQPIDPKQLFQLPTDPEDELIKIDEVLSTPDEANSSPATPNDATNEQEGVVDVSTSEETTDGSPTIRNEQESPVVPLVEQVVEKIVEQEVPVVEFTNPSPPLNKTTTRRFKPRGPLRTTISNKSEQEAASTSSSKPTLPTQRKEITDRHAKKNCWNGSEFSTTQQILNEALNTYQKRCELERIMARVEDPEKYQNPFEKHKQRVEKFGAIFTVLGINYVMCKFSNTSGQWPAKISDVRKSNQFYELSQHLLRIKNQKSRVIFYN